MSAQSSLRPEVMFAILLYIGITGWSVNAALLLAQRRLFGRAGGMHVGMHGGVAGEPP
jgi:NitT/TauT family transport system permease protein